LYVEEGKQVGRAFQHDKGFYNYLDACCQYTFSGKIVVCPKCLTLARNVASKSEFAGKAQLPEGVR